MTNGKYQNKSGLRGMTLLEVLAGVVIIALLAGLLFPALSHGTMAAERTKCAANLRQIGTALQLFAAERGGWLPETTHTTPGSSWILTLEPYLDGRFDEVRLCPADPKREARRAANGTSYILNEFTSVDLRGPFGDVQESFRHLLKLPFPSRTMLAFVVSDRVGVSGMNDHTHSRNWDKGWNAVLADIQPDRHRTGRVAPQNTNGTSNYLFADGHVETISALEMKARVDSGVNPARPPGV